MTKRQFNEPFVLSENFTNYYNLYQDKLVSLKQQYPQISPQKLAYWQFCAESQKRACYRNTCIEKIDALHANTSRKSQIYNAYRKLIKKYYRLLNQTELKPIFQEVGDMNTFFEFKLTEREYYEDATINEDDTDDGGDTVDFPDEIVNYNIYHSEDFLALSKNYNDQSKVDAISAFSRFGLVIGKDISTETRMTNIYVQPIHLFHDKVNVSIDFNLTKKELIQYITDLQKKFNELPEEVKTMPSQLIKKSMINSDENNFSPIDAKVASRIYTEHESQYPRILLMYDAMLLNMSKSAASTLISQILSRKRDEDNNDDATRLNRSTQKFFEDAVTLMTNNHYTSQCKLLQNLKSQKLRSF